MAIRAQCKCHLWSATNNVAERMPNCLCVGALFCVCVCPIYVERSHIHMSSFSYNIPKIPIEWYPSIHCTYPLQPNLVMLLKRKKSHTFSFQFGGNSRAGDVEPAADEIKHFDSWVRRALFQHHLAFGHRKAHFRSIPPKATALVFAPLLQYECCVSPLRE